LTLRHHGRIGSDVDCPYVKQNEKGKCPCTLCIVKCMCEEGCPSFDVFKGKIDNLDLRGLFNE
jgi:hypothetical protein